MKKRFWLLGKVLILAMVTMVSMAGCDGEDGISIKGDPGAAAVVDYNQINTYIDQQLAATAAEAQLATATNAGFTGTQAELLTASFTSATAAGYTGTEAEWTALQADAKAVVGAAVVKSAAAVEPESCAACHVGQGDKHQASYNLLYQDGVIQVSNLAYSNDGTNDIVTFNMTKSAASFDCTQADSLGIYYTEWDGAQFSRDLSIKGTLTYNATTNVCTSTKAQNASFGDVSGNNGLIVLYGTDEILYKNSAKHISSGKYPFAAIQKLGTVNYTSAANVSGCEKCHTKPYLKHTYIYGEVNGTDEFYTCKACHYDTRNGGHAAWQLLVSDPAAYAAQNGVTTAEQNTKYAYKAKLMNDVHMSHAMEFGYPQSMSNCATCHEGKLANTLTDANFTLETCKSCHPVEVVGTTEAGRAPALIAKNATGDNIGAIPHDIPSAACNTCHTTGGIAPVFNTIHTGYNTKIYADANGTKYSDVITATIDSAVLNGNILTVQFSATGSAGTLAAADITPTLMVGLYGYNTKDFIVPPHGRTIDSARDLEYVVGATSARFTTVTAAGGNWEVTADLSTWADKIASGVVKRAEIAVMPKLVNAAGVTLAMNAPSRTFDLGANAFDDTYYSPIVKVATGCNNCHDALGTTFHSGDRGGNIVVCRLCHAPSNGGSHLEMQSRSIDSYAHAIHSFQAFDPGDIDFNDPVEALRYQHKIESDYPTFGIMNCESCHNPGTYNVPDQAKSLPGILSAADKWNVSRNIGAVPAYVVGPASRACGSCHRSELINEDKAGDLAALNQHTKQNGYLFAAVDNSNASAILAEVVKNVMAFFK